MKVSVLTILVFLLAAGFPFVALSGPALDVDSDTVLDVNDNCLTDPNGAAGDNQCDVDQDGYGNACDTDANNDGGTGGPDYPLIDNFIGACPGGGAPCPGDLNCDGGVGGPDYPFIDNNVGAAPGPSGLACAGSVPCP